MVQLGKNKHVRSFGVLFDGKLFFSEMLTKIKDVK